MKFIWEGDDCLKKVKNYLLFGLVIIVLIFTVLFIKNKHDLYIPILIYHNFSDNIDKEYANTTISPAEFESQIKGLVDKGYTAITFSDLYNFLKGHGKLPSKPFIITMDDGYQSTYVYAYPILKKLKTPAAIFIVPDFIGKNTTMNPCITWDEAKEMEKSGLVEIQNHSLRHEYFNTLTKEIIIRSALGAQNLIEKQLGKRKITVFSYPGGHSSKAARNILQQQGFDMQLTGLNKIVTKDSDMTDLNRVNVKHGMSAQGIVNKIWILEIWDSFKSVFKFY